MAVRIATKLEQDKAIEIAKTLGNWFTPEAIGNMYNDFSMNHLAVNVENEDVNGFSCYAPFFATGTMHMLWLGVHKDYHKMGIGGKLLNWIEEEAKRLELPLIEVETLSDEVDYEPYERTRNFYYKYGFQKIAYKKSKIEGWDDTILLEKRIYSSLKPVEICVVSQKGLLSE